MVKTKQMNVADSINAYLINSMEAHCCIDDALFHSFVFLAFACSKQKVKWLFGDARDWESLCCNECTVSNHDTCIGSHRSLHRWWQQAQTPNLGLESSSAEIRMEWLKRDVYKIKLAFSITLVLAHAHSWLYSSTPHCHIPLLVMDTSLACNHSFTHSWTLRNGDLFLTWIINFVTCIAGLRL
jgi:hypothetical protein